MHPAPTRPSARWLVGAVLLAVVGCRGGERVATPRATMDPDAPLAGYAPCEARSGDADIRPPRGIVLPAGGLVLARRDVDDLVEVDAYVDLTPVQVVAAYEALDEVVILTSEDEVFEAELLLDVGDRRTYVQARAVCERGSNLLLLTTPADGGGAVPVPSGASAPVPSPGGPSPEGA